MRSNILTAVALTSALVNGSVLRRESTLPCGATTSYNHTVVSGDTLSSLSYKSGAGICDIAKANDIANPNLIYIGEVLIIPSDCKTVDNTTCLATQSAPATATCVFGFPSAYTVKSGDTLTAIAENFNITLAALEADNEQISNPDLIYVGENINIPVCKDSQCTVVPYTIKSGDTFYDLAFKYGSTVGQIESINPTANASALAIGQNITLPEDCKSNCA